MVYFFFFFFFLKQKTAYEMVGSDWSSDVCSSDLLASPGSRRPHSRQYSWFGSCGVPQRGQGGRLVGWTLCGSSTGGSPSRGGETVTAYSSQRSGFGLPSSAPT